MIVKEGVRDFDLVHIFECGQCFRWEREPDGSYTGMASGAAPANISFHPSAGCKYSGRLVIDGGEISGGGKAGGGKAGGEKFWDGYFDLSRDYGAIKKGLSEGDAVMAEAVMFGQGIRILGQDIWETVVSFIISQNNNIGRIKGCIASLCDNFGGFSGEFRGKKYHEIPGAEVLAGLTESDLAVCRLGYRARYLIETAKAVSADKGEKLYSAGSAGAKEAFSYLTSLCGVGPKVANCIMLFSMGMYGSFPIDVWVRQAMSRLYGIDKDDVKAMESYARDNFGEYGGIAQQYLFYYMRSKKGD